jgi:hypothetical protein
VNGAIAKSEKASADCVGRGGCLSHVGVTVICSVILPTDQGTAGTTVARALILDEDQTHHRHIEKEHS